MLKDGDEERETVKLHMPGCCAWARAAYTGAHPGAVGSAALSSDTCEDTDTRPESAGNSLRSYLFSPCRYFLISFREIKIG
jgi:hypothetical protein